MFEVFISHDTADYNLALQIHDTVHKIGKSAYIYELYRQYHKDIGPAILDILRSKSCHACLCLLTYNGVKSPWVHQELGAAYALNKIIIPVVELGIDYKAKGFVQFRQHIDYDPADPKGFICDVIWALRNEVFGHNPWTGLTLRCPNGHQSNNYVVPSTEEINEFIKLDCDLPFKCTTCGIEIKVSPWTFEEII
ncbi:MAG: toll/interleukin-1 receptor domain-containing protein [Dehalococcoidia bacterium]|nr:toll/interleukin-1 receptor domain-containing protein [Dehalococcoidia bacterium]